MAIRKIISRSTWGAQPPKKTKKTSWHKGIKVFIHHTQEVTLGTGESASNEYLRLKKIQSEDMTLRPAGKGLDDIRFHYIIMPSGNVYEGRGKAVEGQHCVGHNNEPGIAIDGDYSNDLPSEAALKSLSWLLDELNLDQNNLQGHKDGDNSVSCPGDEFYSYIKNNKLPSWKEGSSDSDDGTKDISGYTFPKGVAANAVTRIVPMPEDDPFSPNLIANKEKYYNSIDPNFKKSNTSRYLDSSAYFSGGVYDTRNMCSFSYYDNTVEGEPIKKSIWLLVPPENISWSYSLRTKVEDTYGGQVIQILGVQIDNFKLSGYVPNGFWGIDNNYYNKYFFEDKENARKNGIVHLANFFRDFFTVKSQSSFSNQNMRFSYPHYGWEGANDIKLIPYEFPRVRIANDEILPQWELECSLVEYLSSHFVSKATTAATNQLKYNKGGIGFVEFIQWSDPTATSDISVSEEARSLGASYAEFVNNFDITESDALSQAGFTYPPDVIDRNVTSEVQKVIEDRFGINV